MTSDEEDKKSFFSNLDGVAEKLNNEISQTFGNFVGKDFSISGHFKFFGKPGGWEWHYFTWEGAKEPIASGFITGIQGTRFYVLSELLKKND